MALNNFIWTGVQQTLCRGNGLVQKEEGSSSSDIVAVQGNTCNLNRGYMTAAFFLGNNN